MGEIGKGFEPNVISGRDSKLYLLREDISRNLTLDLSVGGLSLRARFVLQFAVFGTGILVPSWAGSPTLWDLSTLSTPPHRVFLHSAFPSVMFCHLISFPESSLRAGTASISCLCSPWGIGGHFAFLKSSINICRMSERISRIKFQNYSRFLLWDYDSLRKKCQLYCWHILLCFSSSVLKHNPIKKKVSSLGSFLVFSLPTGSLIRMLKSYLNPTVY